MEVRRLFEKKKKKKDNVEENMVMWRVMENEKTSSSRFTGACSLLRVFKFVVH